MSHLELVTPKKQLIRESYNDFMLSREAMLRTPKTLIFYRYTVGGFVEWLILQGITEPHYVKLQHIRAFLAETAERGVKDITVHAFARGARSFLYFLFNEGYMQKLIKGQMPKVGKKRLPVLSAEQVKHVVESCISQRDEALILFLLDTGVRSAELCSLTWGDDLTPKN